MKVLILGAGPAGLMAAHAAAVTNNDVFMFSKKRKSYMRGAQYLHAPIPMFSTNPFTIDYKLEGTVEGYRDKVYGPDPRIQVSVQTLVGSHFAWDMREAYDGLWNTYGKYVEDLEINPESLRKILKEGDPHVIVSSIPAPALCMNTDHMFQSETVWVTEYFRGGPENNVVICNGEPDVPWYRTSRIQNWANTEYPNNHKPPLTGDKIHEVLKPIKTNCNCWPEIHRVGRYGTWTKGVLSHEAYYSVFNHLASADLLETNQ